MLKLVRALASPTLLCLALVSSEVSAGAFQKCTLADGTVTFTDKGCPSTTEESQSINYDSSPSQRGTRTNPKRNRYYQRYGFQDEIAFSTARQDCVGALNAVGDAPNTDFCSRDAACIQHANKNYEQKLEDLMESDIWRRYHCDFVAAAIQGSDPEKVRPNKRAGQIIVIPDSGGEARQRDNAPLSTDLAYRESSLAADGNPEAELYPHEIPGSRRLERRLKDPTFKGFGIQRIYVMTNGEMYQQVTAESIAWIRVNPKVTLYRTNAGYRMAIQGVNKFFPRVRRYTETSSIPILPTKKRGAQAPTP